MKTKTGECRRTKRRDGSRSSVKPSAHYSQQAVHQTRSKPSVSCLVVRFEHLVYICLSHLSSTFKQMHDYYFKIGFIQTCKITSQTHKTPNTDSSNSRQSLILFYLKYVLCSECMLDKIGLYWKNYDDSYNFLSYRHFSVVHILQ